MLYTLIYMLVAGLIAVLAVVLVASMEMGEGDRLLTRRTVIPVKVKGDPLEAIAESLRSDGFNVYRSEAGLGIDDQLVYWQARFNSGLLIIEEGVRLWVAVIIVLLISLLLPVGLVATGYTYLRMRSLKDSVRAGLARAGAPLEALLLV